MPEYKLKPKRAYRKTSETQEIIFDTALSLMSEKGFQGTTVREICSVAQIPIGTFYNCYKSKIDILKRIYDNGDAYIQESIAGEASGLGAMEQLRNFASNYARLNEETGIEVLRVLFYPSNKWFSMVRPMQSFVKTVIESGQKDSTIRSDLSADEMVESLFDILRGVCYNWCVCDGAFDLTLRIKSHMDLFCAAISK